MVVIHELNNVKIKRSTSVPPPLFLYRLMMIQVSQNCILDKKAKLIQFVNYFVNMKLLYSIFCQDNQVEKLNVYIVLCMVIIYQVHDLPNK